VADEEYKSGPSSPAALREFPDNLPVWQAACLNCHDSHTVQGARRLLREGPDAAGTITNPPKQGSSSALEEVCYQCHTTAASSVVEVGARGVYSVPDLRTDFSLPRHMPITNAEQSGSEVHDVVDSDLLESQADLGNAAAGGSLSNRHAECTDCHNPHRVRKSRLFFGTGTDIAGTHPHDPPPAGGHTNIISGVLRGAWGVEPQYGSASFQDLPSGYQVKRGDPLGNTATAASSPYVTREYQICLKCHSDYGYLDDNVYPAGATRPLVGAAGTPQGTMGVERYTNQAKELQAPVLHRGEGQSLGTDGGASPVYNSGNHRGWHPVVGETGRTPLERGGLVTSAFESPWASDIGTQTMYCSDCHGSTTAPGTVVPNGNITPATQESHENGSAWGPHGSADNFILKGDWDTNTGTNQQDDLCFKCHDYQFYATGNREREISGFCCDQVENLHGFHFDRIGSVRCTWCHVAVPHGWKNKALLVNLNDVGPEGGQSGVEVCTGGNGWGTTNCSPGGGTINNGYDNGPYYQNAFLKVINFKPSGEWLADDCGSASGAVGRDWMRDEACDAPN
jgi:hypothetical protein